MEQNDPKGPPEWRRQPGQSILNVQRWGEGVNVVAPVSKPDGISSDGTMYDFKTARQSKSYGINADTGIYADKIPLSVRMWKFGLAVLFRIRVLFGARVR